MNKKSICKL